MDMNLGIIIQARTGSTRLPNKMVLPFFENKGILEILLQRLINADMGVQIIVATTTNAKDDIIADVAKKHGCIVYRGSEENVLSRFVEASAENKIDRIIRVCADNPFLDISFLRKQIESFSSNNDYVCYALSDGTPTILTHYGFWAEGVSLKALEKVQKMTSEKKYMEHVTNYIYNHPNDFDIKRIYIPKEIEKRKIRLTIDTQKDFSLAQVIYRQLFDPKNDINATNVIKLVEKNTEWLKQMNEEINKNIK